MKSRRSSVLASATVAVLAVAGLGACTSSPSAKRVTRDMIESLQELDDTTRDCMLEVVDGYSNEQLEDIGAENANFTSMDGNLSNSSPEFQEFVEALRDCNTGN